MSEPRPLRDSLAEVSAELGLAASEAFTRLCARWSEVVDADVSAHSRPRSLRDGVLAIEVDEAPWATRLRYLESDVIRRSELVAGEGVIRAVRVTVSGSNSGTLEESI